MSRPATSCARRKQETASSYCSRKREFTIASRKVWVPSVAVYQAGRGNDPMIEVGSITLAEALNMSLSPNSLQTLQEPCTAQPPKAIAGNFQRATVMTKPGHNRHRGKSAGEGAEP